MNFKSFSLLNLLLLNTYTYSMESKSRTNSLDNLDNKETIFTFIKMEEKDVDLVKSWINKPHVSRWWPSVKQDEDFFDCYLKRMRSNKIVPYLICLNNKSIGYIQYYLIDKTRDHWLPELPENTIGTDQFIGLLDHTGKGYGPKFMSSFIQYLIETKPKLEAIIVDPEPENLIAIKCYEKVGFKSIGHSLTPLGDAIIMQYNIK